MIRKSLIAAVIAAVAPGCGFKVGDGDRAWNTLVAEHRRDAVMDGYRMHYIDMGSGPAILMIHGYADSTYCWNRNVAPLLDAGFRVVLVDQLGLGRSGVPSEGYVYSVENQAAEILKLADRLSLGCFDLVGSSMGGGVALYLGLKHPDRVGRVVVSAPACFKPPGPRLLAWPGAKHVARLFGGNWAIRKALKNVYENDDLVTDVLLEEYCRAFVKPGIFDVLAGLSGDYFSAEYDRMTESYGRFEPKLLIVWGDGDSWIPPTFGEKLHSAVPGSTLKVIKGSGHLPHQESFEIFNPLLVEFLREDYWSR